MLNIILPHRHQSRKVENWSDISSDVKEMVGMVNRSDFKGLWPSALALSHAQVSKAPFCFFVVAKGIVEAFGSDTVINAKIIDGCNSVTSYEACLSFPFRPEKKVRRRDTIVVEYWIPNKGLKRLLGSMERREKALHGLAAWIVQHEVDHSHGICIY